MRTSQTPEPPSSSSTVGFLSLQKPPPRRVNFPTFTLTRLGLLELRPSKTYFEFAFVRCLRGRFSMVAIARTSAKAWAWGPGLLEKCSARFSTHTRHQG